MVEKLVGSFLFIWGAMMTREIIVELVHYGALTTILFTLFVVVSFLGGKEAYR